MRLPSQFEGHPRVLRIGLGIVYLVLTVMLLYALRRFIVLIMPHYGQRFGYMVLLFVGVACWTAYRGLQLLVGRTGERGRKA
jgi:hypothetical protein